MNDYRVKIIERLSTVVTVREENADSEEGKVQAMYRNGEIVLTAEDYADTEIKVISDDDRDVKITDSPLAKYLSGMLKKMIFLIKGIPM